MTIDRRKNERFYVDLDIFAALRGGFKKVGKVHDIGIKGLGFSYLREVTQFDSIGHDTQVDIFMVKDRFHLFNLPCKIVYENTSVDPYADLYVNRFKCGLCFEDLSKTRLDLLNFLIKNYIIKTMPAEKRFRGH